MGRGNWGGDGGGGGRLGTGQGAAGGQGMGDGAVDGNGAGGMEMELGMERGMGYGDENGTKGQRMGMRRGTGLEMEQGMGYGGRDGAKELGMKQGMGMGLRNADGFGDGAGSKGWRWSRDGDGAGAPLAVPPGCSSCITCTPWLLANCSPSVCSDISPLLKDPVAFKALIDLLEDHLRASFPKIDVIAGGCSAPRLLQGAVCSQVLSVGRHLANGTGNTIALGHCLLACIVQ